MAQKPSYEELEQRVKELEKEALGLRKVEKDLRIFKTAVESSINAIGITDLEGKLIYVNDSCVKMWGHNSKDDILGRFLPEFWEGDGVFKTIKELREKGKASGEDVGKRKDGSLFYVQFTASMFKDEVGNPSFMFGSFFNIAERKNLEMALRESEEKYRRLFEMEFDAIFFIRNSDGQILEVNTAGVNLYGFSREELLKMKNTDLSAEPDKTRKAILKRKREVPTASKKKGWNVFPVEITGNHFTWRDEEVHIASIRDIPKRKQAEEALRESEEQYRSFVQNFRGIAFRGRMDFTPIFFHGSIEEITGYKEKEFLDGELRWDQVIHPEDLPTLMTEDEERLHSTPHYSYEREYRIICKNGAERWVHEVIQNICDESGKPTKMQGAIYDITDRKQMEEALRETEKRFKTLIAHTTDAIFCYEYDPPIPTNLPPEEQVKQMYDCVLMECNDICARSYGFKYPDEVIGKKLTELFGTTPNSLDKLFIELIQGDYQIIDGEGIEIL
jgi:PAS domain S-box-containing protein